MLLLLLDVEVVIVGGRGADLSHILSKIIGLIIKWGTSLATHILRIHVHVVHAWWELLAAHRHASVACSAHTTQVVLVVVMGLVVLILLLLLVGLLKVELLIVRRYELIVVLPPAPMYLLLVIELMLLHLHVHLLLTHGRLALLLGVEGL